MGGEIVKAWSRYKTAGWRNRVAWLKGVDGPLGGCSGVTASDICHLSEG